MKKYILYAFIVMTCLLTSCDLNINDDPNYPQNTQVTADLIFPSIEASIASAVGGEIYNYAGFFAQYYDQKPESNQYNTLCEYTFTESSQEMDYSYRTLFAGALEDVQQVLDKTTNPADIFAATVLRAYTFQVIVDNTSDSPYTEAMQGNSNAMPKWDNGEDVYKGVLNELEAAESQLEESSIMSNPDLLLNKSVTQWIGFANALRLRMYLRFIDANVDVANYTDKVKALVQTGNFFTGDVKLDCFIDETSKRNPWYTTNAVGLPGNHCAAYPLISYLSSTNDPRIAYGISKTAAGKYVGQMPGGKRNMQELLGTDNWKNKDVSAIDYSIGVTKPVYFFTQAELQFLIAEVYERFLGDDVKAKSAYEAAVSADFKARGLDGQETAIIGTNGSCRWASATTSAAKLNLIYMQKWVALFYMDHMEAWSEIRRTDCPNLSSKTAAEIQTNSLVYNPGDLIEPWTNGLEAGGLMKRMTYPLTARQHNTNTPGGVSGSTPVWWDVK